MRIYVSEEPVDVIMDFLLELTERGELPAAQNDGKTSYIAVPEGSTLCIRVPNSMYMHRKWNYGVSGAETGSAVGLAVQSKKDVFRAVLRSCRRI